jgi:hypothetical protein
MDWLIRLLTGPVINGAIDAYKAKLAAGNDRERIAADLAARELEVQRRERELAATVLIVEQGHWATRWVRPVWAAPFVLYTWKVVVWDICLGWGSTDAVRGDVAALMMIVAGTYFSGRSLEKIASSIWGRK